MEICHLTNCQNPTLTEFGNPRFRLAMASRPDFPMTFRMERGARGHNRPTRTRTGARERQKAKGGKAAREKEEKAKAE